jgi:probable HAF family extracellular repeat protein
MHGLGNLSRDPFIGRAHAVSADGSVIVGQSYSGPGLSQAFRWSAGSMAGLGFLPGRSADSVATAVSADGSFIVGASRSSEESEAFRWHDGSMIALADLPGGAFYSMARGVSADGTVVVGKSASAAGDEAFIWHESTGMSNLRDWLERSCGLDLGRWRLVDARVISQDARAIVGFGINPEGEREGWIALAGDGGCAPSGEGSTRGEGAAPDAPPPGDSGGP